MTWLEKLVAKWLAKRIMYQNYHKTRIVELYEVIHQTAKERFYEDNKATLDGFLQECFDNAGKV